MRFRIRPSMRLGPFRLYFTEHGYSSWSFRLWAVDVQLPPSRLDVRHSWARQCSVRSPPLMGYRCPAVKVGHG
jgi:hypothetical protein